MIQKSSERLRLLVNGVLEYSQSEKTLSGSTEEIQLSSFFKELENLYKTTSAFDLTLTTTEDVLHVNKSAFNQIIMNLISNAIHYNEKDVVRIWIELTYNGKYYEFKVIDNGVCIHTSKIDDIFQLFETSGTKDRFGTTGTGIGLSTVSKVVEKLGGEINVTSEIGVGTTFPFIIKHL
ncbi:MAG: signal transduction histidine kinase [Bacteroidia bacterium]|jgi:signal transduction histidine kinase